MLAIIMSFFAGMVVTVGLARLAAGRRREREHRRAAAALERENAIRADLVEHQLRDMLGAPRLPYLTAATVAAARRALDPVVVIKVKP
ncbi:MAG TPA: hypothetical protein VKA84_28315 [Gemmatimonadaceae bacterium]|nr:hypothetical protein [Gemmatimonadaceae bacterium]